MRLMLPRRRAGRGVEAGAGSLEGVLMKEIDVEEKEVMMVCPVCEKLGVYRPSKNGSLFRHEPLHGVPQSCYQAAPKPPQNKTAEKVAADWF